MTITRCMTLLACGAVLALGACTDTKTVGDEMALAAARAALADEKEKTAEVEARRLELENTLNGLRRSLADTQAALEALAEGAPAGPRAAVAQAQEHLERVQAALQKQPASPARTEVDNALKAVDRALDLTVTALSSTATEAGLLSLASMHTSLDEAQNALNTAQSEIADALKANGLTPALRDLLLQAQATLTTAQSSLLPVLRQELAQAEKDARGETTLGESIAPERLARNITPAFSTGGTANVTWTARTKADGTAADPADKLDIEQDAVLYETGKMLISANAIGTDEFQLRGLTVRGQLDRGSDATGDLEFHGGAGGLGVSTGTGTIPGTPSNHADRTKWQRTDAKVLSSIQLKEDGSGFTMKMGGAGVIFYDMERLTAIGPNDDYSNQVGNGACANVDNALCDDPTTSDIAAVFDNPAKDPDGDASWHFSMVVPTNPETPHTETRGDNAGGESLPDWVIFKNSLGQQAYRVSDAAGPYTDDDGKYKVVWALPADAPVGGVILEYRRANRIANGLPADQLGVYTVKLSNYAGVDDDNEHRYLRYAAYGLFNFLDYSGSPWFSRMQAFHFGYDAFSDADDNRPMDFNDDEVTATFNGKTTGWVLQNPNGNAGNISQLVRLRGDVSLTATLGGGTSNGAIEGSMKNFEFLQSGAWSKLPHGVFGHSNAATTDGVTLMSADIGADGSYAGVAKTADSDNRRFGEGRYGGRLLRPPETRRARDRRPLDAAETYRRGYRSRELPQREDGTQLQHVRLHHRQLRRRERAAAAGDGVAALPAARTRRVPPGARRFFLAGVPHQALDRQTPVEYPAKKPLRLICPELGGNVMNYVGTDSLRLFSWMKIRVRSIEVSKAPSGRPSRRSIAC